MAPAGCQHRRGDGTSWVPALLGHPWPKVTRCMGSSVAGAAVQGHQHGSGALHGQQQCMDTGVWWLPASHGYAWLAAWCQHGTGTLRGCTDMLHEHSVAQTSCRGAFAGCQRGTGSGARSECGVRQGHPQGGITQRQSPPLLRPWGCEVPPPAVGTRDGAELGDTRGPRAPREGGEGSLGAHSIPLAQARLFRSCHPEVFGLGSPAGVTQVGVTLPPVLRRGRRWHRVPPAGVEGQGRGDETPAVSPQVGAGAPPARLAPPGEAGGTRGARR